MFDLLPNQMHGFARSAGEAFHPNLWAEYLGGMTPCLGLAGRNVADVSPYRNDGALVGNASLFSVTGSPIGPAVRFAGNVAIQWDGNATLGNKFKVGGNNQPITLHAYFKYVAQPSSNYMAIFRSDSPTVGGLEYGYQLLVDAYDNKLIFQTHRGESIPPDTASPIYSSAANSLTGGRWHNVAVTWYPLDANDDSIGQFVVMNIDGQWIYPTFTGTERDIVHLASQHSRCGASFNMTAVDMEVALVHVWKRRPAWREIDLLMVDPLAMFRRRVIGPIRPIVGSRIVSIGGAVSRRIGGIAVAG